MIGTYCSAAITAIAAFALVGASVGKVHGQSHSHPLTQGPSPTPIAIYANAESGLQGCGVSDGWVSAMTWTGDDIDTDGESYYTNSCEATSLNKGASYNSTLTLTMNNESGDIESGTWSGQRSVTGMLYAATSPHFAHSSVIDSLANVLYDETNLPDKTMYLSYFVKDDTSTTDVLDDGGYQSFDDFFTLEGAAG